MTRAKLLLSLFITAGVMGSPINDLMKVFVFLLLWYFTFQPISSQQLLQFLAINGVFTVLDCLTVSRGVFFFNKHEFLNLSYWEPMMWGFYLCWTQKFIAEDAATSNPGWLPYVLVVLFSIPFSIFTDYQRLFLASSTVLAVLIYFYHEKQDIAYMAATLGVGTVFEYTGVWSHQWFYPGAPMSGVPLWYITLWCGVGLFNRRLVVPLFHK